MDTPELFLLLEAPLRGPTLHPFCTILTEKLAPLCIPLIEKSYPLLHTLHLVKNTASVSNPSRMKLTNNITGELQALPEEMLTKTQVLFVQFPHPFMVIFTSEIH